MENSIPVEKPKPPPFSDFEVQNRLKGTANMHSDSYRKPAAQRDRMRQEGGEILDETLSRLDYARLASATKELLVRTKLQYERDLLPEERELAIELGLIYEDEDSQ